MHTLIIALLLSFAGNTFAKPVAANRSTAQDLFVALNYVGAEALDNFGNAGSAANLESTKGKVYQLKLAAGYCVYHASMQLNGDDLDVKCFLGEVKNESKNPLPESYTLYRALKKLALGDAAAGTYIKAWQSLKCSYTFDTKNYNCNIDPVSAK